MNPPVSRDSGGFWFLDWNESGFETGPRAGVMLLSDDFVLFHYFFHLY